MVLKNQTYNTQDKYKKIKKTTKRNKIKLNNLFPGLMLHTTSSQEIDLVYSNKILHIPTAYTW